MSGFNNLRLGPFQIVIDTWSSLAHKQPLREREPGKPETWQLPRTWVGEQHRRRIIAYQILAMYAENSARWLLRDGADDEDIEDRREYGDVGLLLETYTSAMLGESQEIIVKGADNYDPRIASDAPPEDVAANNLAKVALDRQNFLRDWAEKIVLELRLLAVESDAAQFGDGVILLAWDSRKKRPIPAIIDPGFYFPVLPDSMDGAEYPNRVHFAWELPGEDFTDGLTRVRRLTYELRPVGSPAFSDLNRGEDDARQGFTSFGMRDRSRDADNDADEIDATEANAGAMSCFLTDATWKLDDITSGQGIDSFDPAKTLEIAHDSEGNLLWDHDLGIDFIPVVHIPNTPALSGQHFGKSTLSRVLQLVDDLHSADTDTAASSTTTGKPILTISGDAVIPHGLQHQYGGDVLVAAAAAGNEPLRQRVAPGEVWRLGPNGKMDALNTSAQLAEGRSYALSLRDRMLVNSRISTVIAGTAQPTHTTGVAMELSFAPTSSMIRQARIIRRAKYALLLKMVQRMFQVNNLIPEGELPAANIALGAFLPRDRAAAMNEVTTGYGAGVISLETAVQILIDAGFPIEDAYEEVKRIEARSFDEAGKLADATGDQGAVRTFLGLPQRPGPQVPIAGGTGVGVPNPTDSGDPNPTPDVNKDGNAIS